MKTLFSVKRNTTESQINVELDFNGIKPDYRKSINTPIPFLNHMIEHIAWRSCINISVDVKLDKFDLSHVICEDVAITMGKAFLENVKENAALGIVGYGDGVGIIDEAYASSAISFEGRAGLYFDTKVDIPTSTEGMLSEDVLTFLEGFVQGANCTLHINVEKGQNGHHIWEAIFRSVGIAVGRAMSIDEKRVNMTSGVAGKIEFEIN